MNTVTKDPCPKCGQKGLPRRDQEKPYRRKCSLCRAEEPRPFDRVLYLACSSSVEFAGEDKPPRLGGWWHVEPFFSWEEAEDRLAGVRLEMETRSPGYEWQPTEVGGHRGLITFRYGHPTFHFVQEKLVDIRPLREATT